ncbi:hypothetical protein [Halobacillus naozhouensis]|uniref:Uncharacterized protein n=1 Tax=Halobacillus naozhouensis TaxID=554880 RepID=A0ABY8IWR6_9BACI|nr:hypothetical protein [Halobacillus naozhouensis]WFT74191.1 hypothetical protein P9989_17775 [Halobacillus naozhouensis]
MDQKGHIQYVLAQLVTMDDITIEDYPHLPYGKKVIDQQDDYMIIYWDKKTKHVKYTFKGMDNYFFILS